VPATLSQQGSGAGSSLSREVPEWLGAAPTKLHAEHVSQKGPRLAALGSRQRKRFAILAMTRQAHSMGSENAGIEAYYAQGKDAGQAGRSERCSRVRSHGGDAGLVGTRLVAWWLTLVAATGSLGPTFLPGAMISFSVMVVGMLIVGWALSRIPAVAWYGPDASDQLDAARNAQP
jgi:hypothetical protein